MTIPSELMPMDYYNILKALYPLKDDHGIHIIGKMINNVDTWEDLNDFVCDRTNDILNGDYIEDACIESVTFRRVFVMYLKEIKARPEGALEPHQQWLPIYNSKDAQNIYDAFRILNGRDESDYRRPYF